MASSQQTDAAQRRNHALLSRWGLPLLLLLVVVSRLPFYSHEPYSWDAFNFIMGVEQFSPADDMPHFPGYGLHIGLGKLFAHLVGGVQAGLQAASLLYVLITVVAVYGFAQIYLSPLLPLRDSHDAILFSLAAAALTAFNPMFWHFSETALAYDGGAMIGIVTVGATLLAPRYRGGWIVAAGLIALLGGIRPDSAFFGLFWVIWAIQYRIGIGTWLLSSVAVAVGAMCWLLPAVQSAGGFSTYFSGGSGEFGGARAMYIMHVGGTLAWIVQQTKSSLGWIGFTAGFGTVVVLLLGRRSWRAWVSLPLHWRRELVLWAVPPILIAAVFFHGGHFQLALAPLTLGITSILLLAMNTRRGFVVAVLGILTVSVAWFSLPVLPNGGTLPYTQGRIDANDHAMASWRSAVGQLDPGPDDAILFYDEVWPWRAAVRDFPDVTSYQIVPMPDDRTLVDGAFQRHEFVPDPDPVSLFHLKETTNRLLIPGTPGSDNRVAADFPEFRKAESVEVGGGLGVIDIYLRTPQHVEREAPGE